MKKTTSYLETSGVLGTCGGVEVFLGFASAKFLNRHSFADILDEETGRGYQRPHNKWHSLDFKKYICRERSSTIPLVLNLRGEFNDDWRIERGTGNSAKLGIRNGCACFAQIDCQHRLAELHDLDIELAFMTFIGLSLREEMAMFSVINSKARGLSSSLTDYHESSLLEDIANEAPHLFIARKLNEDSDSPWFRMIRYGGENTSGLKRRTSLRMMQTSVKRFLDQTKTVDLGSIDDRYNLIRAYWQAVQQVFPEEWGDHRHHLISKGVGLYSLMMLLTDIVLGFRAPQHDELSLAEVLSRLRGSVDWRSKGMFANAGGQKGAREVYAVLKELCGL